MRIPEDRLAGASVWEHEIYDVLGAHERDERQSIAEYEALCLQATSKAVRYLIDLILEDERRHHSLLGELKNRVRALATFEERGPLVPFNDIKPGDAALLESTRRFLARERGDRTALRRLARKTRRMDGGLDGLVVELLRSDTERHIRILRFIEGHLKGA